MTVSSTAAGDQLAGWLDEGEPWSSAAVPMDNPYCSCMLTRSVDEARGTHHPLLDAARLVTPRRRRVPPLTVLAIELHTAHALMPSHAIMLSHATCSHMQHALPRLTGLMLSHALSYSLMLSHALSCSLMLYHALSCSLMLSHALSCSLMFSHAL